MREIPLTKGKVALVDAEDYERVSQFKWCAFKRYNTWYSHRRARVAEVKAGSATVVPLHRFILNAPKGSLVDHRNGDGLDCRRSNIRLATIAQNAQNQPRRHKMNKSGYRGVSLHQGKWHAVIRANGKSKWLGGFDDPAEAARTWDDAALKCRGDFASLNFPKAIDEVAETGGE